MVVGVLNVDLLVDNLHAKKLKQLANICKLEQIIDEPTRLTAKTETLIDHIYCNAPHICMTGTIQPYVTDHLPIFLVLKKSKTRPQFKEIYVRSIGTLTGRLSLRI